MICSLTLPPRAAPSTSSARRVTPLTTSAPLSTRTVGMREVKVRFFRRTVATMAKPTVSRSTSGARKKPMPLTVLKLMSNSCASGRKGVLQPRPSGSSRPSQSAVSSNRPSALTFSGRR